MKRKYSYFYLFFLSISSHFFSQTGPAGVGTNNTSAIQNRIWYKADAGVFSDAGITSAGAGSQVQQWNDQSGVGNNAVQATSAYRPTYRLNVVNGFPALRFSGSNFITAGAFPGIANNVGYTYLVVVKDTSFTAGTVGDGSGDYIIDRGLPGTEANELAGLKVASTNKFGFQKRDGGGGGLGGPVSTSAVNTAAFQIVDYRQQPGSTKTYDIFVDGALETTITSSDANYVPPVPQIGHHYQPASGGMKGYITEFILYNVNLNDAQVNILNNYLAAKYALTLASNEKYTGDTPGNGNYDFEVAGVGKESSGANSSASSSISGGLEVVQATAMGNGEYLIYGHQSGANSLNTTDVGGMSAGPSKARWNRIWYLDWTHVGGSTETVNMIFDLSDAGVTGTPATPLTNYKLLYRTGLSGNWTELATASSISGDRITFNGVAYTSGDGYYTIGTIDNPNSTLPIGLLEFNATVCDEYVCLDWATATETNNDFFSVERSADGYNFESIATIRGGGTNVGRLSYTATDTRPYRGISYYQLKQTDFDGSNSVSPKRAVDLEKRDNTYLNIYPKPNNGIFDMELNPGARVSITDGTGQIVLDQYFSAGKHSIDMSDHLNGIYFVRLSGNAMQAPLKFIKH